MYKDKYLIIDSHCHIYPEKIAEKASESTGVFYDEKPACKGTVEELLSLGQSVGIDRFIVQSVATAPKQVPSINQFIANKVAELYPLLIGFGTLHPESQDIVYDFEHLMSLGLKGIKLHPDIQGFRIDDPKCLKIYELCEQNSIPVLLHTGDKRYDYSNPNRLIPVLKAFPNLTVIGAHLGGWSIWDDAVDQLVGFPNLYVDCSSSLCYISTEYALSIIRQYGANRVLFGTDFPLHSPQSEMALFMKLDLTDDERKMILNENILRLIPDLLK